VIALIQVDDDHVRIFLEQLLRFGGGAVAVRAETQPVARAIPDTRDAIGRYSEERRGNEEPYQAPSSAIKFELRANQCSSNAHQCSSVLNSAHHDQKGSSGFISAHPCASGGLIRSAHQERSSVLITAHQDYIIAHPDSSVLSSAQQFSSVLSRSHRCSSMLIRRAHQISSVLISAHQEGVTGFSPALCRSLWR
jgi:hypothetical protein